MVSLSDDIIALSEVLGCTYVKALAIRDKLSYRNIALVNRDRLRALEHDGRFKPPSLDRTGDGRPLSRTRIRSHDVGVRATNIPAAKHIRNGVDGGSR